MKENEITREALTDEEFQAIVDYFKILLRWRRGLEAKGEWPVEDQADLENGNSLPKRVT